MDTGRQTFRPTEARIDLGAVVHNVRALGALTPAGTAFMAVVKADAYGHGAVPVARAARDAGASWFGVALLEEALELRGAGLSEPVLVLGAVPASAAPAAVGAGVRLALFDPDLARALDAAARGRGRPARVHLKIDTGMGRVGVRPEDLPAFLDLLGTLPGVEVEGVFTHFATADETDLSFARNQLERFHRCLELLSHRGVRPRIRHAANTAGILALPESHLDLVRAGIGLYGIYPSDEVVRSADLRPVLRWTTRIAHLKDVPPGTPLSYGRTHVTPGPRRIATLPVGYGDGYPRLLSNRGAVLVRGRRAPVVGRVCMDMILVDVTEVPGAEPGDEVVLLGRQGEEEIPADELARLTGTIPYEITCNVGKRVPRRLEG
ncbi:alanine racemase [Deferrisoma sp.]